MGRVFKLLFNIHVSVIAYETCTCHYNKSRFCSGLNNFNNTSTCIYMDDIFKCEKVNENEEPVPDKYCDLFAL